MFLHPTGNKIWGSILCFLILQIRKRPSSNFTVADLLPARMISHYQQKAERRLEGKKTGISASQVSGLWREPKAVSWEEYDLPYVSLPGKHHDDTFQAYSPSGVGWHPIVKSL